MTSPIGEQLKKLRNRKNWSLRELETRTNINYSVLSRIEAGKRPVTDAEILTFARIFSVSPNYLLDYKEEELPKVETPLHQEPSLYDQLGITEDKFQTYTAYQQEVLEWAATGAGPLFKNKSDNLDDMIEQLEIAYEVYKAMNARKKKK